jgi:glycogen operon protein
MRPLPARLEPGSPFPLGAHWNGLGVNFAVFSAHAARMELCVFDAAGARQIGRFDMPEHTDDVWHGYMPDAMPGLVYGYRAHGAYEPQIGHRFNPNKLLLDPYAKGLAGRFRWTDALFGYRVRSPRADLSFDKRDSAPAMLKAVVTENRAANFSDTRPYTPWPDTVIYEAHLRGLTVLLEDVNPPDRGTFAALSHPTVIRHLKSLGVTAIELMPVHAFLQNRWLLEKKLSNYWGYNTVSFFAPEQRYLSTGVANEIRMAIRRLHAADIEVILDVAYNHTSEGSELGPTLSWRGLDNASYYRLVDNDKRHFVNDTGTGNSLNLSHPRVLQMVMDSLRYWAASFQVDGFRFDLGMNLGRDPGGYDRGAGFFDALMQDPLLNRLKLITEPWDIGPGGYQLGNMPVGFSEWNDRYRDTLRRYWRGDANQRPDLARRIAGSADIFGHASRCPRASLNYITSHDGMTLEDLVSYAHRHNEANGSGESGHGEPLSANWGTEGSTKNKAVLDLRDKLKRTFLTTLFASLGTPMLLAGDEFGRTQFGNDNAYCQDNDISWVDWTLVGTDRGKALAEFVARLADIRHTYPAFRAAHFLHGRVEILPGILDIDWFDERGGDLSLHDWRNTEGRALVMRLGRARRSGAADLVAVMMNASADALDFILPGQFDWCLLIDSANPEKQTSAISSDRYRIDAHSAAIIAAAAGGRP